MGREGDPSKIAVEETQDNGFDAAMIMSRENPTLSEALGEIPDREKFLSHLNLYGKDWRFFSGFGADLAGRIANLIQEWIKTDGEEERRKIVGEIINSPE